MFFGLKKKKEKKFVSFIINVESVCRNFLLCLAVVCVFSISQKMVQGRVKAVSAAPKGYLAIVIDDFGYGGEGTDEMLGLPIPITCALMPFSEKSKEEAGKIKEAGKELIIHMPMESLTGKKSWVGSKGVFRSMTDEEVKMVLEEAFQVAEGAAGLNNHMGSAIMEDERTLNIVIQEVLDRDMFFLDSKTTPNSRAKAICEAKGSSVLSRDVFLDSTDDINVVKRQLMKAANRAVNKGTAIAIGHVGPEGGQITVDALKELKGEIEKMGVEFVTLTQMKEVVDGNK